MGTSRSHEGKLTPPWADAPAGGPAPTVRHQAFKNAVRRAAEGAAGAAAGGGGIMPTLDLCAAIRVHAEVLRGQARAGTSSAAVIGGRLLWGLRQLAAGADVPGLNPAAVFGPPVVQAAPLLVEWAVTGNVGFEVEQMRIALGDALVASALTDPLTATSITPQVLCQLAFRYAAGIIFAYLWLDVGAVAKGFTDPIRAILEASFRGVVNCAVTRAFNAGACVVAVDHQASEMDIAQYLQDLINRAAGNLEACACP